MLSRSGENAGIVDIGNGYALVRMEDNHPIFIDPFMVQQQVLVVFY